MRWILVLLVASLTACGGGGSEPEAPDVPTPHISCDVPQKPAFCA